MDIEALFRQYYPRMRNFATRIVERGDIADDIVQECFIKLYEKRFSIRDVSPGALLFVMVRNSCINYLRRRTQLYTGMEAAAQVMVTPEDEIMYAELQEEIEKVMRTLPPRCREVFYMSRFEGLKVKEIAERTGTSTQNVEKHISRALEVFARHFGGLDIYARSFA
jgi:RNA polymerase sigma-70 factor (ECF subfamily)